MRFFCFAELVSPLVMLPGHRLAGLLSQAQATQINNCLYHSTVRKSSLYKDHVCDRKAFPSVAKYTLDEHGGHEVWQIKFSNDGTRLASCGMDRFVVIYSLPDFKVVYRLEVAEEQRGFRGAGNLAWSPDDRKLVSCAMGARVWNTDVSSATGYHNHVSLSFTAPR